MTQSLAYEDEIRPAKENRGGLMKNSGCTFMLGCMAGLLCILLVMGIGAALMGGKPEPANKLHEVWISGKGKDKLAVVHVRGAIMEGSRSTASTTVASEVVAQLQKAQRDNTVKGVLILANSPGGGVTASDKIYHAVKNIVAKKPVVVLMGDVCASGCVYMSAHASHIMAHPTTITGSIGVITSTINITKLFEKIGIEGINITSKENKALLSPYKPINPEHIAILKKIIDEMYDRFVSIVSEGRKIKKDVLLPIADGRVFTGAVAKQNKLVDSLGYKADALTLLKKLAGVSDAKLVKYRPHLGLAEIFLGYSQLSQELRTSQQVSLERLLHLKAPRVYYMWSPQP